MGLRLTKNKNSPRRPVFEDEIFPYLTDETSLRFTIHPSTLPQFSPSLSNNMNSLNMSPHFSLHLDHSFTRWITLHLDHSTSRSRSLDHSTSRSLFHKVDYSTSRSRSLDHATSRSTLSQGRNCFDLES